MTGLAHRRMILLAAAAIAGGGPAWPGGPRVTVDFEGGGIIPKGRLTVELDDGGGDGARLAAASSTGGSTRITLSLPPGTDLSSPRQVVVRLEREDGWLLARGSAQPGRGAAAVVTLYTVMHQEPAPAPGKG